MASTAPQAEGATRRFGRARGACSSRFCVFQSHSPSRARALPPGCRPRVRPGDRLGEAERPRAAGQPLAGPRPSAPARARGPRRGAWPARPGEACSGSLPSAPGAPAPKGCAGESAASGLARLLARDLLPGAGRQSKTNGRGGLGFFKHRIFIKILI